MQYDAKELNLSAIALKKEVFQKINHHGDLYRTQERGVSKD